MIIRALRWKNGVKGGGERRGAWGRFYILGAKVGKIWENKFSCIIQYFLLFQLVNLKNVYLCNIKEIDD